MSTAARFETLTAHVDRFTPDDRSDRPALGAIHGLSATLIVEGGASVEHLRWFLGWSLNNAADRRSPRSRSPTGTGITAWARRAGQTSPVIA